MITVTQVEEGGWWEGTLKEKTGWFPCNYVKECKSGTYSTDVKALLKLETRTFLPNVVNYFVLLCRVSINVYSYLNYFVKAIPVLRAVSVRCRNQAST